MKMPESEFIWMDLMEGSPVLLMDEWTLCRVTGPALNALAAKD